MRTFSLRSLLRPPTEPIRIDPHELSLATSPFLRSLSLRFDFRDEGFSNYNYYAVLDMIAGGAPNLREVALLYESSGSSPASLQIIGVPSQPWRHDLIPQLSGTNLGQLTSLELCVRETGDTLRELSTRTDFSALENLRLHSFVDADTFRWLTKRCRWGKLNTLVITPDDEEELLDDLYEAMQDFLKAIPPLRSLKITKHYDQATLRIALESYGPSLQQLLLTGKRKTWLVSIDTVRLIGRHCPALEELFIPVRRLAGSAQKLPYIVRWEAWLQSNDFT